MRSHSDFNIEFIGLKLGEHFFDFDVSEKFFNDFDYFDFTHTNIKIDVSLVKKNYNFRIKHCS